MQVQKSLAALVLCCLPAVLDAQPRPNPRPHYKALCIVNDQGHAKCIKFDDLNRLLTPAQIQKLQNLADDLFPQLTSRLSAVKNTLADCGHGNWVKANLTIPPSAPTNPTRGVLGSPRKTAPFPSVTDAEQLVSQCRSTVQSDFDRAVAAAGVGASKFVKDTVAQMDAAVANCRDQSSPVAASTGGASGYVDARDRYNNAVNAVTNKYSAADLREGKPGAQEAYYALFNAASIEKLLDDFFHAAQTEKNREEREQTFALLTAVMNDIADTLEKIVNPPPSSPPPPPPAPGQGPVPAEPPPPPKAAAMPCMGDGCRPTCGDIAARWSMFKSYCDQSQWKAWQCVSFLAKANGCADPRLINPGPEGDDMPCPANARVDKWTKMKAAWVEQCKKRQWIMMPTQDGKFACVAPDFQGFDAPKFDPCNNPQAMPGPDDCTGPTPNIEPSRPAPKPDPRRPGS